MEKRQSYFTELEEALHAATTTAWDPEPGDQHVAALAAHGQAIAEKMMAVGEAALAGPQEPLTFDMGLVHFGWAEQAKAFLILWRDVLFQTQKADLLAQHGKLGSSACNRLRVQSQAVVQAAASELLGFFEKEKKTIEARRGGAEKQLRAWALLANPWPKYRDQLAKLAEHYHQLVALHRQQRKVGSILTEIHHMVLDNIDRCSAEIKTVQATAAHLIEFMESRPGPGMVANRLEDAEADINLAIFTQVFTSLLDERTAALPEKLAVPVGTDGGLLQVREISFRKRSQQWLESEILPVLYEVWEVTERTGNSLKMSLANIRNRALLLAADEKGNSSIGPNSLNLAQPLHAFLKSTQPAEAELRELHALVGHRLKREFGFAMVFQARREYLPIPLQSTIDSLRLDQHPLLAKARRWFERQLRQFRQTQIEAVLEEQLSTSEKVVRYLHAHTPDLANHLYSNIFLTKGYVGESFIVGREEELKHMGNVVANWRLGYRGAVLLSGRRFVGKSLFGELVSHRHFTGHTLRVLPESPLAVGGRRIQTSCDLGPALDFIEKHALNDRPLVWIDDLELWTDTDTTLSQNVRKLLRFIDNNSDRMFFLVSLSSWLLNHLDRSHDIRRAFQAEINLNRMAPDEIRQAILIRHGATHKILVDEEGKTATPQQFQRMCDRIFHDTGGNVGETLTRWSASIRPVNEEVVRFRPAQNHQLPHLLSPDNRLLLRTLLLEKRTNEYRLRKAFGPAFKEKYGSTLQRLLHTGLLTRRVDGWLEVNEVAANEVGRQIFEAGEQTSI